VPVAGDVGKRASEDVAAFLVDPEGPDRAGGDHPGRQREVLAAQYQAVAGAAAGTGDRRLGTGSRCSGQPEAGGPGTRRLAVGDELNVDSGQPTQGVLVAFEHHDVDIGVVTRDVSCGQVDSPASGNPPGNSQARQQRADGMHWFEAGAVGGVHQNLPPGETAEPFPWGWRSGLRRCCWRAVRP
jgi:hypothetical protein